MIFFTAEDAKARKGKSNFFTMTWLQNNSCQLSRLPRPSQVLTSLRTFAHFAVQKGFIYV